MKFQMKALAAASMLAVSGLATAAIDLSATGGARPTSEMVFVAYDAANNITYSRDLGTMISEFNFATNGTRVASVLTGWDTFLNTAGLALENVRWGLFANDVVSPVATYVSTPGAHGTNPNTTRAASINAAMTNLINLHNFAGTHATEADGWAVMTTTGNAQAGTMYNVFTAQQLGGANARLDQSQTFLSFTAPTPGGSTRNVFGNTMGPGLFSVSNGNLMYATAPIPEP
jgi:hypothetical protein